MQLAPSKATFREAGEIDEDNGGVFVHERSELRIDAEYPIPYGRGGHAGTASPDLAKEAVSGTIKTRVVVGEADDTGGDVKVAIVDVPLSDAAADASVEGKNAGPEADPAVSNKKSNTFSGLTVSYFLKLDKTERIPGDALLLGVGLPSADESSTLPVQVTMNNDRVVQVRVGDGKRSIKHETNASDQFEGDWCHVCMTAQALSGDATIFQLTLYLNGEEHATLSLDASEPKSPGLAPAAGVPAWASQVHAIGTVPRVVRIY